MSKRDEIISKSLELFLEKGYERTSLNEIANLVGVTKPAIYYYFDDKQALYEEVCREVLKLAEPNWPAIDSSITFKTTLEDIFGSMMMDTFQRFKAYAGQDDPLAVFKYYSFVYEAMTRIPWFRESINEYYAANMNKIRQLMEEKQASGDLRADLDSSVVSFAITALIEGSLLLKMTNPEIDLEIGLEKFVDNVWNMLRS